jgi:hypothetical protein
MKSLSSKITQLFLVLFIPLSIAAIFSACGKTKAENKEQKTATDDETISIRTAAVQNKTIAHDIVGYLKNLCQRRR